MSTKTDDTLGCIGAIVAVVGGGWWLWSHYEVRKRADPPPIEISVVPPPARPTGLVVLSDSDANGAKWLLDADSVTGVRTARQGWVVIDAAKDKTQSYRTDKTLYLVNCSTSESRKLSDVTYGSDGKVIAGKSWAPDKADISYFPPGTMGGAVTTALCSRAYDTP